MSRIAGAFAGLRKRGMRGLVPYITAGDPDLTSTCDLVIELAAAGATAVELGVPFSDPMADGPVIQRASERALRHGFGLAEVLDTAAQARRSTAVPLVLFSYFNPLLQFGPERLAREAARAGIDGVLVTDLPPEEAGEFSAVLEQHGLDLVLLVAPTTTDERLRRIAQLGRGFLYAVSRTGVTGTRDQLSADAARLVTRIRGVTDLPVAVGFGISHAEHVAAVWQYADAAVVGSAIVAKIERHGPVPGLARHIGEFVRGLMPAGSAAGARPE